LSIRQPWAWLIVHGFKDIENRAWRTAYRGPFLVHAGLQIDAGGYDWAAAQGRFGLPPVGELPRGGIVGRARVVDCVTSSPSQWFEGPYGFVLADQQPVPFVPLRGRLRFFEVP
jgi:hypothetical protein